MPQASVALWARSQCLPESKGTTVLPVGQGRSYGDCCLNPGGLVVATDHLDRYIEFDVAKGTLSCEAGTRLGNIIDITLPHGWFLPVVPGTQFVSLGGAIANDVHGKNHHRAGTFGSQIIELELLRSNGQRLLCSERENPEWFRATVAGLGLTGLITWAKIKLRPVQSAYVETEDIAFATVEEFIALSQESDHDFEYTVAWFDSFSYRAGTLRGILSRARHVEKSDGSLVARRPRSWISVPFDMPQRLLGPNVIRLFNQCYAYGKNRRVSRRIRMEALLFPLDMIRNWNRIYGRSGFMQLQCVIPDTAGTNGVSDLLQVIARGRQGSFLAVLKRFGAKASPGVLSFPMPGTTVALDFQNLGSPTDRLLQECHKVVVGYGGRIYPAKDASMTSATFQAGFPAWRSLIPYIDPRFSSGLWRRVSSPAP